MQSKLFFVGLPACRPAPHHKHLQPIIIIIIESFHVGQKSFLLRNSNVNRIADGCKHKIYAKSEVLTGVIMTGKIH